MNSCLHCNKETNNPKFCSRSCSASFVNVAQPRRSVKCQHCESKAISWRKRFCETHYQEHLDSKPNYQQMTLGQYKTKESVKGKHPSWVNAHVRGFARSWLKHLTKQPCNHCGYSKHVELAHIQALSTFTDDTLLGEINAETNVIPLCPNCHWEFDNLPR